MGELVAGSDIRVLSGRSATPSNFAIQLENIVMDYSYILYFTFLLSKAFPWLLHEWFYLVPMLDFLPRIEVIFPGLIRMTWKAVGGPGGWSTHRTYKSMCVQNILFCVLWKHTPVRSSGLIMLEKCSLGLLHHQDAIIIMIFQALTKISERNR